MTNRTKGYSREFKIEVVKLSYNRDQSVTDVATKLGISKSSLSRWRRELGIDPDQAFPGKGQMKERDVEVAQLKKELREAQMENEKLKKRWPSLRLRSVRASRRQRDEIPIHPRPPRDLSSRSGRRVDKRVTVRTCIIVAWSHQASNWCCCSAERDWPVVWEMYRWMVNGVHPRFPAGRIVWGEQTQCWPGRQSPNSCR
jgi:transposase